MCDEAVDDCLAALKVISDWFVTSEMIKKLFTDLYADKNILQFNEGSYTFYCNKMGILNIDLNNISLDIDFDGDDPDTIILIRLFPLAQHPDIWWDWCMSEDEKKEIDPIFIEEL